MSLASNLADAKAADREADRLFEEIDAARKTDSFGSRPIIPHGFEGLAERASDLRRRARSFRADASELRAGALVAATSDPPAPAPATSAREAVPRTHQTPVETAETVAARILASDSVAAPSASPLALDAAAETLEAVVARVLNA